MNRLTMPHAARIATSYRIELPSFGPEDILVVEDGTIFTGTHDGWLYQITPNDPEPARIANTGGIPLGLECLPDGRILVCDAEMGLLALDRDSGKLETLIDQVNGSPLVFCNNAAVGSDGTIYFSQSSTRN